MNNHNKRIITIAGKPGSGKSTTSKAVAKELGYEHFSSGDLFRAIGKERGADVHETNVIANEQKDIDQIVDQRLRDIGEKQERVVIDSRLAWHWIPDGFKVYLDLDLRIAAKRILENMDPIRLENEKVSEDPQEYALALQARLDEESKRYKNIYNVNPYDEQNYDLVINTNEYTVDEVVNKILEEYTAWLSGLHV